VSPEMANAGYVNVHVEKCLKAKNNIPLNMLNYIKSKNSQKI
jgi:hypothetical protein